MTIKELRVGNFVNFKNRDDIDFCEITSLDSGGYIHLLRNFKDGEHNDDQPENIDDITPIILTDKWLERLQGQKTSDEGCYEKEFIFNNTFYIREEKQSGIYYHRDTPLKYVHQLQNLYYFTTYQELVFNK